MRSQRQLAEVSGNFLFTSPVRAQPYQKASEGSEILTIDVAVMYCMLHEERKWSSQPHGTFVCQQTDYNL